MSPRSMQDNGMLYIPNKIHIDDDVMYVYTMYIESSVTISFPHFFCVESLGYCRVHWSNTHLCKDTWYNMHTNRVPPHVRPTTF